MRILVCGDRDWKNKSAIHRELSKFPPDTVVIHGGARGADNLGGEVALELGFQVIVFEADWDTYGKAAGPIRNRRQLVEGEPDLVLAFHENIAKSKGTKDMISVANKAKVKVILYDK